MHSIAIFSGVMLFAWGLHGLKMFRFYVALVKQDARPWLTFWDRWIPNVIALATLPLSIGLAITGGTLIYQGFFGV